jgi:hypothetical protein
MLRVDAKRTGSFRRRSIFVGLAVSLATSLGVAGEPHVSIGEISGKTRDGEFAMPLRSALEEALDTAKLGRPSERFVLSASLEMLEAKQDGRNVSATAVVSIVVRRNKDQTLRAILRGNATALESDSTLDSARETAVRAAAGSAMRRLAEAVK